MKLLPLALAALTTATTVFATAPEASAFPQIAESYTLAQGGYYWQTKPDKNGQVRTYCRREGTGKWQKHSLCRKYAAPRRG